MYGAMSTEAAGSLALYISKAATFRTLGALPADIILKGLITGSSVMAGTYAARLLLERLHVATFQAIPVPREDLKKRDARDSRTLYTEAERLIGYEIPAPSGII